MSYSKSLDIGQLPLPFSLGERALKDHFEEATGKSVSLIITDNSTSIISVKTKDALISVRLHRIFLNAGNDVIKEITEFVRNRKKRLALVRQFVRLHHSSMKKTSPGRVSCKTAGLHHNLLDIYASINREYFGNRIKCSITWGHKGQGMP